MHWYVPRVSLFGIYFNRFNLAAHEGSEKIVELLLANNANVNQHCNEEWVPLHIGELIKK